MRAARSQAKSIDEYLAAFPRDVQAIQERVRETIRKAAPSRRRR